MNHIEAWKAAKDGEEISNGRVTCLVKKSCHTYHVLYLSEAIKGVCDCHLLSNDWEVVKEKEKSKIELRFDELRSIPDNIFNRNFHHVPDSAKVTIEWTE